MQIPEKEELLTGYDPEDMYHKIIHLPEQVLRGYYEARTHFPETPCQTVFRRIVLCGMGGSAIAGDIAKAAFGGTYPIEVVKDYNISALDEDTLVIVTSYSGGTEETLSCLQQAIGTTPHIGAITSGGAMREQVDGRYPWVEVPAGYPPRSAVGWLFFALVRLLEHFEAIPSQEPVAKRLVASLITKAGAICIGAPGEMNLAKQTAISLQGRIPAIYASHPSLAPLAYRWKCQINENCKLPAFSHTLPEMCHNEIEGWENKNPQIMPIFLTPIIVADVYQRRLSALKKVFENEEIPYLEFLAEGDTVVEQVFGLLYLGDMISYYLAMLNDTNSTDIRLITALKHSLSQ